MNLSNQENEFNQFNGCFIFQRDLIRRDEILARQLQEELDKEMAESLSQMNQSHGRHTRRHDDVFDPNDFLVDTEFTMPDSLEPTTNMVYRTRSRPSNPTVQNNQTTLLRSTTTSFQPPRRIFSLETSGARSSRRAVASTSDDYRQTNLHNFLNHHASANDVNGSSSGSSVGATRRGATANQRPHTPEFSTAQTEYFDYLSRLMPDDYVS